MTKVGQSTAALAGRSQILVHDEFVPATWTSNGIACDVLVDEGRRMQGKLRDGFPSGDVVVVARLDGDLPLVGWGVAGRFMPSSQ